MCISIQHSAFPCHLFQRLGVENQVESSGFSSPVHSRGSGTHTPDSVTIDNMVRFIKFVTLSSYSLNYFCQKKNIRSQFEHTWIRGKNIQDYFQTYLYDNHNFQGSNKRHLMFAHVSTPAACRWAKR